MLPSIDPDLEKFLGQYVHLPVEVRHDVVSRFREKSIEKNGFVLTEGRICNEFVFVKSGCLRLFYETDKTEISVWFAFPGSTAIEISSFISDTPSAYSIQAIEKSTVLYLTKAELTNLCEKHPSMHEMMRRFWEDAVVSLIRRFTALQKETAEKRYTDLLKNTDYINKIPQKYLASFLGVTPTSLSRIRRNVK